MSKPRSIDQHRRFFAVLAAVRQHWPESHRFQPDNAEHLRAWLLVRAGHHTVKTFHLSDDATEMASLIPVIIATMTGRHSWARSHGNELHVCVPESIAFDKIGHQAFCKLNDDVDEVIRAETGLDPERLIKETEAAA
jgi:hypothetical protein